MMKRLVSFPILASYQELKNGWAKFEAKKVLSNYHIFPQVNVESDRFIEFLTETGVVGIAHNYSDNSRYINAEYEYTLPTHLRLQPEDKLAVHPIFSCITCKNTYKVLDQHHGIYPKGSSISEDQDKKVIRNKYIRSA